MLKTLVKSLVFLAFKPEFSRRLSRIFFRASSRLSRNFRGRLSTNRGGRPAKSAAFGANCDDVGYHRILVAEEIFLVPCDVLYLYVWGHVCLVLSSSRNC